MTSTYTKLKSGDWGVRVIGEVTAGDTVTVTKRDGTTKRETITNVLWTDGSICLCSIGGRPIETRAAGGRRRAPSRREAMDYYAEHAGEFAAMQRYGNKF